MRGTHASAVTASVCPAGSPVDDDEDDVIPALPPAASHGLRLLALSEATTRSAPRSSIDHASIEPLGVPANNRRCSLPHRSAVSGACAESGKNCKVDGMSS